MIPRRTFAEANEKLYATQFSRRDSAGRCHLRNPAASKSLPRRASGGEMIVKPLDGHGGEGFLVTASERNIGAIFSNSNPIRNAAN